MSTLQNSPVSAVVGLAKCPRTKKIYGVRIDTSSKDWKATWAFPVREEVAQREGYSENEFPSSLQYDREYPGCPYCKRFEDLAIISRKPKPKDIKLIVSKPGCDDIGSILRSMNIKYRNYSPVDFKCDVLFINCLTSDFFDRIKLNRFVSEGGCLYASCYADEILKEAFPGIFNSDHSGMVHSENVIVEDLELRSVIGKTINVQFDTAWAKLYSASESTCILRSTQTKLPIMVSRKYGKGIIFFTCFHNHVQASEKEHALLQLLVLRQIGMNGNMSLDEAGQSLGVDVEAIKAKFKNNW